MDGRTYNTYPSVPQELWQHKQTSPLGFALWISSFTGIIPGHPVDNSYLQPTYMYIAHIHAILVLSAASYSTETTFDIFASEDITWKIFRNLDTDNTDYT